MTGKMHCFFLSIMQASESKQLKMILRSPLYSRTVWVEKKILIANAVHHRIALYGGIIPVPNILEPCYQ